MTADRRPKPSRRPLRWLISALACLAILGGSAGALAVIFSTEPAAQRETSTKETAMLVEVTPVERGDYRPRIVALGTVEPAVDIMLRPRVGGMIVEQSEEFAPGGFVSAGDVVMRIDPSDYENTLAQRQAELEQARADLQREKGLGNVAEEEYQMLGEELQDENRALVLREPQLQAAKARVASALAAVRQAELELERTEIRVPFDATVLTRQVNVGTQVDAGDVLGRVVGLDEYWVVATVPVSNLSMVELPASGRGAPVRVRHHAAWPQGMYRQGWVTRLVGAVEENTRLARVVVTVPDPLGRDASSDTPPLILGTIVRAEITARELESVVRLPRELVRTRDTVWTFDSGALRIRDVDIAFRDAEYAYVASGLGSGARVVETNLSTVTDGAPLRVAGDPGQVDDVTAANGALGVAP